MHPRVIAQRNHEADQKIARAIQSLCNDLQVEPTEFTAKGPDPAVNQMFFRQNMATMLERIARSVHERARTRRGKTDDQTVPDPPEKEDPVQEGVA